MKAAPPFVSRALPLLGHALEFNKDRGALFRRGYDEHGKAFAVRLGPKKAAVLIGPEFHKQFFKETDKALDMSKPYRFFKPIFGEVVFVADHATYMQQRPVLQAPFRKEKMLRYLDIMHDVVQKWLDSLPDEGRLELTVTINRLVQEVAGHALLGEEFMARIGEDFWQQYVILGKAIDPLLPPNWPLPKFIRRNRARKKLWNILKPIIEERRANPGDYDDFLQEFVTQPQADGTPADDEAIIGLTMALMFAGHETTAGQAAWTIIQLLQHPRYLARVQDELKARFPYGQRVDARTMSALKHLKWAVDETTRTRPSADIMIRVADEDVDFGEFTVPKGWVVFVAAEVAQFLPELFKEPDSYDPLRFGPDRKEHKQCPHAIIGFGGGLHKCTGMNFALNEMLTIAALLFQQFDLDLETKNPSISRGMGANRPSETWVRFRRKPPEELVPEEVLEEALAAGCPHMAGKIRNNSQPVRRES